MARLERSLRRAGELAFDSSLAARGLRRHRERILNRALAAGLDPALDRPLRWLMTGCLAPEDEARVERVEGLRAALAEGGEKAVPNLRGGETSLARLTEVASVDRKFGALLYLCAKATGARSALELGSCVGIGTAYMASACERVTSVEATPERAEIAARTAAAVSDGVEVVTGLFDEVLPGLLDRLERGVDLAWIDGHHRRDATLRYLEAIRPRLNPGAVVAFDDIRWSVEMRQVWSELRAMPGFSDTVDLGPIGLGVWAGGGTIPVAHDLRGIHGRPRWLGRARAGRRRTP